MRKYATAFTRTGTLSLVITSCRGICSVIVCRSTLTIRWRVGLRTKSHRPLGSAEPEDDAALVLAGHLERADQEEDEQEEDDTEDDERGGHGADPIPPADVRPCAGACVPMRNGDECVTSSARRDGPEGSGRRARRRGRAGRGRVAGSSEPARA